MSIEAVTWVLLHSKSRGVVRNVAYSIAWHADRSGSNSWPSQKTIAAEARTYPPQVRAAIKKLIKIGELKAFAPSKKHRGSGYAYRLPLVSSQIELPLAQPVPLGKGMPTIPIEQPKKGLIYAPEGVDLRTEGVDLRHLRGCSASPNCPELSYQPSSSKPTPTATAFESAESLPDFIPLEPWKAYLDMRREMKRPVTKSGVDLLIRQLLSFRASGQDPGAILDQSVMRGWTGLFRIQDERRNRDGRQSEEDRIRKGKEAGERFLRNNHALAEHL